MNSYLFLLISIIINAYNLNQRHHIFTLSNDKIVLIGIDGIYFYTSKMEEINKIMYFDNQISSYIEPDKISIEQFSEMDKEYIMISIINRIYFFDKDCVYINSIVISISSSDNDIRYNLIPYKKYKNYLLYNIAYKCEDNKTFTLDFFEFDIKSPNSNKMIISKKSEIKQNNTIIDPFDLSTINCNYMFSSNLNKEILICFFIFNYYNIQIQSKAFDPNNYFNEIHEYSSNYVFKEINFKFPKYISTMTNKFKNMTLIYLINDYTYTIIFTLNQKFSEPNKITNSISIFKSDYSHNKMLYLKKTNEILIISTLKNNPCKLFLIYYDSNLRIINKNIIDDKNMSCLNINPYSSFANGTIYSIINSPWNEGNENSYYLKILTKKIRKLVSNTKCNLSNNESLEYDLCISCNNDYDYYKVQEPIVWNTSYVECYNENTKPDNFFLDGAGPEKVYRPCYETCGTCAEGGNEDNHKCLTCAIHHKKKPGSEADCLVLCTYFYYFTFYDQYKCTRGSNCPDEYPFYILELLKCTDDCASEEEYKLQYGGRCVKNCPESTNISEDGKSCIHIDNNTCLKNDINFDLKGNSLIETVDIGAKIFLNEFGYTDKHITYFYNDEYSIVIYKDYNCIEELNMKINKIDFGECYTKVQGNLNLQKNQKLIVALMERKNNKGEAN